MTIGYIGDVSASGVALNADGTIDYSGGPVGVMTSQDNCVVGGLDANGNTIVNCGIPGGGGGLTLPPTCMPGDVLSAINGQWICGPAPASSGSGVSMGVLLPVGALVVLAILMARGR